MIKLEQYAITPIHFPQVEMSEHDSCYLFHFALGPIHKDELSLKIIDNELVFSGKQSQGKPDFVPNFSFVFPRAIDAELARAAYAKGAIQVLVPKRGYSKERMIQIENVKTGFWMRLFEGQSWKHYSDNVQADYLPLKLDIAHDERSECL